MEQQMNDPQVSALEQWKADVNSVDKVLFDIDNIIKSAETGTIVVNRHFIQLARQTRIQLQQFDTIVGMVLADLERSKQNTSK